MVRWMVKKDIIEKLEKMRNSVKESIDELEEEKAEIKRKMAKSQATIQHEGSVRWMRMLPKAKTRESLMFSTQSLGNPIKAVCGAEASMNRLAWGYES
jgi:hypothetical protein